MRYIKFYIGIISFIIIGSTQAAFYSPTTISEVPNLKRLTKIEVSGTAISDPGIFEKNIFYIADKDSYFIPVRIPKDWQSNIKNNLITIQGRVSQTKKGSKILADNITIQTPGFQIPFISHVSNKERNSYLLLSGSGSIQHISRGKMQLSGIDFEVKLPKNYDYLRAGDSVSFKSLYFPIQKYARILDNDYFSYKINSTSAYLLGVLSNQDNNISKPITTNKNIIFIIVFVIGFTVYFIWHPKH